MEHYFIISVIKYLMECFWKMFVLIIIIIITIIIIIIIIIIVIIIITTIIRHVHNCFLIMTDKFFVFMFQLLIVLHRMQSFHTGITVAGGTVQSVFLSGICFIAEIEVHCIYCCSCSELKAFMHVVNCVCILLHVH